MIDAPEAPAFLREMYVTALAKLGRYDEMVKQIDKLTPPPSPAATGLPASPYIGMLLEAAWALRDAGRDAEAQATFRRVLAHDASKAEAQRALLHLYGTAEERAAQAAAVAARRGSRDRSTAACSRRAATCSAPATLRGRPQACSPRAAPELRAPTTPRPLGTTSAPRPFELERWEEAAKALGEAIAVNPARCREPLQARHRPVPPRTLQGGRRRPAADARAHPDKKDAHFYLAGCYDKLGDTAAATRHARSSNAARPARTARGAAHAQNPFTYLRNASSADSGGP